MTNAVTIEAVYTYIIPLPNCLSRVNSVIKIAKKRIEIKNEDRPY